MKKRINPAVKAHLIRGAVYLLLLPTVFATPLVLGQRGATNSAIDAAKIPSAVRVSSTIGAPMTYNYWNAVRQDLHQHPGLALVHHHARNFPHG